MSVMLYRCMLCVALLIDLFNLCVACLTVFMNCLVKQFAICLGVVIILLLNVMEMFSVVEGALLARPCMISHKECVCCVCNPSVRLCMLEVISSFKSSRAGSHVFALRMLFLCVVV